MKNSLRRKVVLAAVVAIIASTLAATVGQQPGEGLFPIQQNSKYGYINRQGKTAIEPRFYGAHEFREGRALVCEEGEWYGIGYSINALKYGYIDETGKLVIDMQFHMAHPFSEGLALVSASKPAIDIPSRLQEKMAYIDKQGRIAIGPKTWPAFENDFHEGLAPIGVPHPRQDNPNPQAVPPIGVRRLPWKLYYGYIDRTGKTIIPAKFRIAGDFSEGFAAVAIETPEKTEKWGFIDKTGQWVIKPQFDWAEGFHEDRAAIEDRRHSKWGYIDRTGKIIIKPQFANLSDSDEPGASRFSEGLARVYSGGKTAYINRTGEIVIGPRPGAGDDFSEGLARVWIGRKTGYINRSGKWAIKPQFHHADNFSDGLARVYLPGLKMAYIDKTGKYVWGPE